MNLPKLNIMNSFFNSKPNMEIVNEYLKIDAKNMLSAIGLFDEHLSDEIDQFYESQNLELIKINYKLFEISEKESNVIDLLNKISKKNKIDKQYLLLKQEKKQYNDLMKKLLKLEINFYKKISMESEEDLSVLTMDSQEYFREYPTYFILMKLFPCENEAKKFRLKELTLQKKCYDLEQKLNRNQYLEDKLNFTTQIIPEIFLKDEFSEKIFEYRMNELDERHNHVKNVQKKFFKNFKEVDY